MRLTEGFRGRFKELKRTSMSNLLNVGEFFLLWRIPPTGNRNSRKYVDCGDFPQTDSRGFLERERWWRGSSSGGEGNSS
ncbi:MAG: hypothetical protein QXT77_03335 [Candidatus Methanomethylicaceae archaeon]